MGSAFGGEWSRLKHLNGKPLGMIGVLPQNSVTFIDNQDTESQKIWPFPTDYVILRLCHSQLIILPLSRRRKLDRAFLDVLAIVPVHDL
ncbi:alpha-amylase-like isoform X1 [Rhododendron vialii]|uniref:alpha-amylase-like isoform X1 n=1 Tax=Rhododendron vialii TaxID=182163 RepID=UPI0026603C52|nr:alpha-amylase-like isoform X1 [Rhododendron vialii]